MVSIPPKTYKRLREVLLACDQFNSHRELQAVFIDSRIQSWRARLPVTDQLSSRVNVVIDYLFRQDSKETQENALVLLLRVLSEQTSSDTKLHQDLSELASELESLCARKASEPPSLVSSPLLPTRFPKWGWAVVSAIILLMMGFGAWKLDILSYLTNPSPSPSPTPSLPIAPELGAIFFSDNFDDGRPQLDWTRESSELTEGGRVLFKDGKMEIYAAPWEGYSRNWKNLVLGKTCTQCSIQVDAGIPYEDLPRSAGIVFGLKGQTSYYQFSILGSEGIYTEWAMLQATPEQFPELDYIVDIASWTLMPPVTDKFTLRVDIQVQGSKTEIRCYLNDNELGATTLPDYDGGQVGVVAGAPGGQGGTVIFDNFIVAQIQE